MVALGTPFLNAGVPSPPYTQPTKGTHAQEVKSFHGVGVEPPTERQDGLLQHLVEDRRRGSKPVGFDRSLPVALLCWRIPYPSICRVVWKMCPTPYPISYITYCNIILYRHSTAVLKYLRLHSSPLNQGFLGMPCSWCYAGTALFHVRVRDKTMP